MVRIWEALSLRFIGAHNTQRGVEPSRYGLTKQGF